MSDSKVNKVSVYDPRVVQKKATYGVQKGALSITNSKFSAISKTRNSLNWNVNVPSLNVYVDKKIAWTTEVDLKITVNRDDLKDKLWLNEEEKDGVYTASSFTDVPVASYGTDWVFNAFPAHQMVQSMSATINDCVITSSTGSTFMELLRLYKADPNRKFNNMTCPSYLSGYAFIDNGVGSINSSMSTFNEQVGQEAKNGAYAQYNYLNDQGNIIEAPTLQPDGDPTDVKTLVKTVYTFTVRLKTTENIMLSPFNFTHETNNECGLFGVNNIQLSMNLRGADRCILYSPSFDSQNGASTMTCEFKNDSPFRSADLNMLFLSPPLDITLPKVSITPYMEYPRYITNFQVSGSAEAEAGLAITSNTITLPQIPDYLICYVKKTSYKSSENDYYFPITKASIVFDNMAGILSTLTKEQLYQMSFSNGLQLDYNTYSGVAGVSNGINTRTIGGFLIAKMGRDIPLQTGSAPGCGGNYSLSLQLGVAAPFANSEDYPLDLQLVVVAANSGYFATSAGSSSIHKSILNESMVMSAPTSALDTNDELERVVGAGFFDGLSSMASKAGNALKSVAKNPAVQKAAANMAMKAITGKGSMNEAAVSGGKRSKVKLSKLLH